MLLILLGLVSALIVALTASETASVYGRLPVRVPLGFTFTGQPRSFGPRPLIWMLVAVQCFIVLLELVIESLMATHASNARGEPLPVAAVCTTVILTLWQSQRLLLKTAQGGTFPARFSGLMIGGCITVVALAAAFAR